MNDNFEQIFELIEERKFQTLKPILIDLHPADIASIISQASDKDTPIIFRLLPKDVAADTFVELDSEDQEFLIKSFSDKELKSILDELFLDDTVDMIEEMPANVVRRILKHSDPETRKEINELLQYPDDSAGSIMTTEFIALKANLTVNNAISYIKKQGADSETLYTCYVVDAGRKLLGCVSLKDILFADRDDIIGEMMEDNVISVYTLDDIEDVANKFQKYDFEVMPVVDKEDRLVGIITVDDAVDVIVDEATEDIQIMNALAPIDDSYLKTPVWQHWSKRIVWLLLLMISGIVSGLIIDHFEGLFTTLPLLVAFIPRLMGTGGNCGSQSSTMIIRGIALEEIHTKDWWRCVLKELGVSLMVGITLAIANVPIIWIMYGSSTPTNVVWSLCLAFGITLVLVVMLAKLLGVVLPILAKILHLDPAIMASPIITTLVDICSVTVYFIVVQAIVIPIL